MITRGLIAAAVLLACGLGASADEPKKADEVKKAIVGRWESNDADKAPVEFTADGKIKEAFIKQNGKWIIAEGTYTVDDKGLVKFTATSGGVKIGGWYRYEKGELVSARGPKPRVTWKKVGEKKEEKK